MNSAARAAGPREFRRSVTFERPTTPGWENSLSRRRSSRPRTALAPCWASQAGLEWLWRFVHEPRVTWRRAFVYGPPFAGLCLLELVGIRKSE
jgi:hypothetical protein